MKKPQIVQVGEPFVVARGLTLKLPFRGAYENVNLDIMRGELCAVVAENNRGKTELLLTIAGRMKPTSGTVAVAGWPLPRKRSRVRRLSGMGFFERVNDVQPVLSVGQVMSAELNLYSRRSGRRAVGRYLQEWGFEGVASKKVEELERFAYVRLGIALGMVGDPQLLVVDDVENDLTRHESEKLMEELKELAHTRGVTVVVACTDYDLALCADKAVPISEWARAQERAVSEKVRAAAALPGVVPAATTTVLAPVVPATGTMPATSVAYDPTAFPYGAYVLVPVSAVAGSMPEGVVLAPVAAPTPATEQAPVTDGVSEAPVSVIEEAVALVAEEAAVGGGVGAPAAEDMAPDLPVSVAAAPAVPDASTSPQVCVRPSGAPVPPAPRGETVGARAYPEQPARR